MFFALLKGFTSCASLIVAIGAQNAFVIRQGLLRRHLFLTATLCFLIDASLILLGVMGFGKIVAMYPVAIKAANYFAIAFLLFYGGLSLKSAFKSHALDNKEQSASSLKTTILLLLAFSLLNPHVYLDTVILLGSIATQQPPHEQIYFGAGAVAASFLWFFSLTYGSQYLSPFLTKPKIWKGIDILIALTMWAIATTLLLKTPL